MTDRWTLPLAELHAAALDGELFAVGGSYVSVADTDDPQRRAHEFRRSVGRAALVADRLSAAWIWGALSRPPLRHTACLRPDARVRGPFPGIVVREPTLLQQDLDRVGGVWVTTPLRTAVDLLRDVDVGSADAVLALVLTCGVDTSEMHAVLESGGPLPQWRRARRRLASLVRSEREARGS